MTAAAVALAGCGSATSPAAAQTPAAAAPAFVSTAGGAVVAAPVAVAPKKTLKLGAKGKPVAWLQKRLSSLGYRPGKADGRYGGSTLTAVWAFQKVNGLKPSSTIGARTWRALENPAQPKVLVKNGKPTRAEVNLAKQIMVLYVDGEVKLITHISSGSGIPYCETASWQGKTQRFCGSARTPTGNYKTTWRRSGWHKSYLGQLYNPIFFNGGIAFHGALSVPLAPASHGCVRLPMNVAGALPALLGKGVPVHVRGAFRR
ncbi:L,D-transpeptidase family protein [Nonomuraea sp. NBC_01738]|uniref:L,D-transpeptidase family protein n=1 Tax=Nonomuraea sp. NBC_01738 TaxID=2976003 RepID=UPI002E0D68B1|nr:L,D-transpeptidase family protein [Nonomuraea sp. NBC_01738]